jgi:hypothetical protein
VYTDIASISRSVLKSTTVQPAKIRCILIKGEIDRALNQAAVISSKQNGNLAAESAFIGACCGSSQDWMRERRANRDDGRLHFLLCRVYQPPVSDCLGLYRIATGVQVDRRQESVDERAEASPAWPFAVSTLYRFHDDIRPGPRPGCCSSRRVVCCGILSLAVRANDVTVRTDIDGQEAWASRASRPAFQAA